MSVYITEGSLNPYYKDSVFYQNSLNRLFYFKSRKEKLKIQEVKVGLNFDLFMLMFSRCDKYSNQSSENGKSAGAKTPLVYSTTCLFPHFSHNQANNLKTYSNAKQRKILGKYEDLRFPKIVEFYHNTKASNSIFLMITY